MFSTTISAGKKTSDAFNEHFISSGYVFENARCIPLPLIIVHLAGQRKLGSLTFLLKPFMNHEAFNALCNVDPKKSTGVDQLRAKPIIISSSNELNNCRSISELSLQFVLG